jgi:hypothetical protein
MTAGPSVTIGPSMITGPSTTSPAHPVADAGSAAALAITPSDGHPDARA